MHHDVDMGNSALMLRQIIIKNLQLKLLVDCWALAAH